MASRIHHTAIYTIPELKTIVFSWQCGGTPLDTFILYRPTIWSATFLRQSIWVERQLNELSLLSGH